MPSVGSIFRDRFRQPFRDLRRRLVSILIPYMRNTITFHAASESAFSRALVWCAELVAPQIVALIWFHRGHLTKAASAAKRAKHEGLISRIDFMLGVLAQSNSADPASPTQEPSGEVNGCVLQVFHSSMSFDPNGYAVRSEQILGALRDASVDQIAVTRLGYPWDLNSHSEIGLDIRSSDSGKWQYLHTPVREKGGSIADRESSYLDAYAGWVEEQANAHEATVIHAHSNYLNGLAAIEAANRLGILCVYEMRGLWHLTRATHEPAYAKTEHYLFCELRELEAAQRAHRVVAITLELAQWLVERGVDRQKITVVPNACAAIAPVAESLTLKDPDQPVIGFVGAFVAYEGLDLLVEAVAELVESKKDLKVILVGDGPYFKVIKKQISELGLTKTFELTGRVSSDSVRSYYNRFDVGVVPRHSTLITELVSSLKPMELMAYGVPCVATSVGPLASVVKDKEHLLMTPTNDAPALAGALAELLDDAALRNRLRWGGLNWAAEHSWTANAKVYKQVYAH